MKTVMILEVTLFTVQNFKLIRQERTASIEINE